MNARNMYRREINKYIKQNCAPSWIYLRGLRNDVRPTRQNCVPHSSVKLSLEIFFVATNVRRMALGTFAQKRV